MSNLVSGCNVSRGAQIKKAFANAEARIFLCAVSD